jgi:3-hydroxymyristoyl/3-hydroxydecanoyl-(acyl carrier protein) dehydratase
MHPQPAQQVSLLRQASAFFATGNDSKVILDPNLNKYQESQMLFFAEADPAKKKTIVRPRTVSEIKRL